MPQIAVVKTFHDLTYVKTLMNCKSQNWCSSFWRIKNKSVSHDESPRECAPEPTGSQEKQLLSWQQKWQHLEHLCSRLHRGAMILPWNATKATYAWLSHEKCHSYFLTVYKGTRNDICYQHIRITFLYKTS